ncbi:MAG TPA: TGS domain-containing protein, partial [Microthrixaceae bacterium]|nr:TGS domain-containing protein [Microthrixaceae bacterium]
MSDIAIKLPDGSERTLDDGATGTDLAASIGKRLAKDALVVEVNGQPVDLNTRLHDGDAVRIVTIKDAAALEHLRHSTAHVLAQAVLALWPGATFAGGPAIEDGFYYDFELPGGATFSDDDLGRIEDKMRSIIAANQPFERFEPRRRA